MRIAINGFGRIGRTVLRQVLSLRDASDIEVAFVNDIAPLDTCAYLFRYDSVFGPYPGEVTASDDALEIDGQRVTVLSERDLGRLPLEGVDVVMDCTGTIHTRAQAQRGLDAGAANVLISGPCDDAEETLVLGANEERLGQARIVSNASCTTNALAPLLKALDRANPIAHGHMTTIHCYTGSQPTVDAPRGDPARSRAAAVSMVPTTSSATRLVGTILPELAGRISGAAVRVPVISVSAIDAVLTFERDLPDDPRAWLAGLAEASPVLGVTRDPTVSTDQRARPESLVIALPETLRTGDRQLRVFGWYDNEWGFSARMIDMARRMAAR
ncbi:glyceraldehyde-3-phosphate dehydrogenase [Roseivivax halodurans JCM 10272]|uniref:Glyceraldehyde-3-phosphate dehydrogenase n=1 Tax=Roseivivax halodurans JCM 10272 TaxID=1449350 RepID=X7ELU6_9RHOB|nr:glyceraldehyde 3-phosphate dehydrogenase NAD-binding domain-containing protein [Roseivivax halodurans]ETX16128.1 glyceraldehyde-3-phosphate dehydrogenase [Roseivivax halodurans JCM 10272]